MQGAASQSGDYYHVLGVRNDATQEDIERAYFDLARKLHPDVAGGGDEATARFMLINEAFQTLSSPLLRKEYDRNLASGAFKRQDFSFHEQPAPRPASETAKPAAAATAAETEREEPRAGAAQRLDDTVKRVIRQADRLCEQGNFWQAADLLQRMLSRYPRQPNLRRALARASAGMMRFREAAEHLKVACEVEYFNSDNHLLLGRMYMKGKQWQKARQALKDALSWNEDDEQARKDLLEVERQLGGGDSPLKKLVARLKQPLGSGGGKKDAGKRR